MPFDPGTDTALPEGCHGLIAGGGFPEVYAGQLATNEPLLRDLRAEAGADLVTWAECGGLLWLCDALDQHPMAGVIPAKATMAARLTLGYRTAVTTGASPIGPAGTEFRGHEFHYSTVEPAGHALALDGRHGPGTGGFAHPRLLASYVHTHLGARPDLAEAFVRACAAPPGRRDLVPDRTGACPTCALPGVGSAGAQVLGVPA